jgi:hypothetical protein
MQPARCTIYLHVPQTGSIWIPACRMLRTNSQLENNEWSLAPIWTTVSACELSLSVCACGHWAAWPILPEDRTISSLLQSICAHLWSGSNRTSLLPSVNRFSAFPACNLPSALSDLMRSLFGIDFRFSHMTVTSIVHFPFSNNMVAGLPFGHI